MDEIINELGNSEKLGNGQRHKNGSSNISATIWVVLSRRVHQTKCFAVGDHQEVEGKFMRSAKITPMIWGRCLRLSTCVTQEQSTCVTQEQSR